MPAWFSEALQRLAGEPILQGLLAALATFVLEDPTTVGSGLLVASGKMAFATALVGVSAGIAIGDLGLYGVGRALGPRAVDRGWVGRARFERARSWFGRNLVLAVLASRFLPGMRLPTYLAAGVQRAPFVRFLVVAIGASIVWTYLLLRLTIALGEAVLPMLGRWRWPVALAALVALVVLQRRAVRAVDEHPDVDGGPVAHGRPVVSTFEFWPPWLFYIPVALYWLWLAARFRGLTLPTAVNPAIPSGGLLGESKSGILDLVGKGQRQWLARYTTVTLPGPVSYTHLTLPTMQ